MEVADLSPDVAKVPKNFRALLFGASEAGKSLWIGSLIRNKDKVLPHQDLPSSSIALPTWVSQLSVRTEI